MYVIEHSSDEIGRKLTCTSNLTEAHAQSQRWYDEGFESKVYQVHSAVEYDEAITAVRRGEEETIWSPNPKLTPREQEVLNAKIALHMLGFDDV